MNPYLRQIEVSIYPNFLRKSAQAEPAWRIRSTGAADEIRIDFVIHRHIASTSQPTVVTLYNLSEKTRQYFASQRNGWLQIKVGYQGQQLVNLYQGEFTAAMSERSGTEIITNLFCSDATDMARKFLWGYAETVKNIAIGNFAGNNDRGDITTKKGNNIQNSSVYTLIESLVATLPNVEFTSATIQTRLKTTQEMLPKGYAVSARSIFRVLDDLARRYAFSWCIVDGVFYLVDDNGRFNYYLEVSEETRTLKRVEPTLIHQLFVTDKLQSISAQCVLLPQLLPGAGLKIVSKTNPQFNRIYKIFNFTHTGSSHTDQWDTYAEALVPQESQERGV